MKSLINFLLLFIITFMIMPVISNSQDIKIDWGGFVKTDIIYDSRQNFSLREGHFLLWPEQEVFDVDGKDLNAKSNFNILSIQTRIQGKITGPEVFGAKTSAYLEGEFFGSTDANINSFRLRHAYVDINWESTQIRLGQFWHPMFITECFANVLSFNTGAPFQPFTRNPQIRVKQKIVDGFSVSLAAITQRDFQSDGPDGLSPKYLRNATIPNLNFGLQYLSTNLLIGANADYKQLLPRLNTSQNYQTDETVNSMSFLGYLKLNFGDFCFKVEGIYGQNATDWMMLGGYALASYDSTKGFETYTPISSLSLWSDIAYGKQLEVGVFAGYSKNLGAVDNISEINRTGGKYYYGRIPNCDNLMRVSPRIAYTVGKFKTGVELEYTQASYGTNDNKDKGKVINTKTVSNMRILGVVFIYF